MPCIFCSIANNTAPSFKIWEDEKHLAFLSIFPNTHGTTVVIPKAHQDSYIFGVPAQVMHDLLDATRTVAQLIDARFDDVGRTGLIFEGFGINHLHAKLFPMHGTKMEEWQPINSDIKKVFEQYEGYLSSHDGPRADDADLEQLAKILRGE